VPIPIDKGSADVGYALGKRILCDCHVVPDPGEDLVLGHDAPGVLGKEPQDRKGSRPQIDVFSRRAAQLVGSKVNDVSWQSHLLSR
jgi:hypothetical protein